MFSFDKRSIEKSRRICFDYYAESYAGLVVDVYKDKENRGTFVFILLEDEEQGEHYNYCLVYPESYIEKGDSIYKPPNSFTYHIFKEGDGSKERVISCDEDYCDKWR